MIENLNHIIESLLFVSEEPLTVEKLKNILETVDTREIRAALQSLVEEYEDRGGGFKLAQVAGGWQLRSRAQYNQWIKRMLQPPPQRLSKAALETLAIVAYNQPIIRADIEHIRGVDCGGVLRQLMERKLIRVLGRKEIPGRPLIYATTKLFLELFELKDLKDLPSPKEIEEMSAVAEETADITNPAEDGALFDTIDVVDQPSESAASDEMRLYPETAIRDRGDGYSFHDPTEPASKRVCPKTLHPKHIASTRSEIPASRSKITPTKPNISGAKHKIPDL
ncbi:MAG: SMC-Scp complex subunit ScpB [Desulfobacteraceae bacterium]|jgi:segregation and condensation protein B